MRSRRAWAQFHQPLVMLHGGLKLSQREVRAGEIVQRVRIVRIEREGGADQWDCLAMLAGLLRHQSQQVKGWAQRGSASSIAR